MIEAMAKSIATFLCKEEIIQEEKKDICRYGIEVIICNAISVLVIIIISILLDTIWQGILLLMIFGTLRICVGGYHAKTYYMCSILFGLTYILTLVLFWWMKNIRQDYILWFFVLIGSLVVVVFAPVKNVNRYITEEEEKKNRRTGIGIYIMLMFILLVLDGLQVLIDISLYIKILMCSVVILMIIALIGNWKEGIKQCRKGGSYEENNINCSSNSC